MDLRLIVAQPLVDGVAPLAVGAIRFSAPVFGEIAEHLGIVVKVAYSFAGDGLSLVQAPPPSLDLGSELPGASPGELAYASDFVPRKPGVDVLVTGHAHASLAASRIDASFAVGPLRRDIVLVASGPATTLPLSSAYIGSLDGVSAGEPTGPARAVDAWMWMPADFDLEQHASAPACQRLPELPSGARIELVGLLPRAERRVFELPKVAPGAVLVGPSEQGVPVALSCDTVWIDTDDELLVLCYRGDVALTPEVAAAAAGRLEVWLDPDEAPRSAAEVRGLLERGHYAHAYELRDALADEAPPPVAPERLAELRVALAGPSPTPAISLDRYAAISAELQEKREPRGDTLRRHGLDEETWGIEERAWMEWMAAGALRGDALPAKQFGERFLAAQEALAGPAEAARTVDDYAPIKAAMDAGADPTKVLAPFSMTLPVWMRLDRRFTKAAAEDPALEAEIARKVAAAEIDPRLLDDEAALPVLPDDDEEDEA